LFAFLVLSEYKLNHFSLNNNLYAHYVDFSAELTGFKHKKCNQIWLHYSKLLYLQRYV